MKFHHSPFSQNSEPKHFYRAQHSGFGALDGPREIGIDFFRPPETPNEPTPNGLKVAAPRDQTKPNHDRMISVCYCAARLCETLRSNLKFPSVWDLGEKGVVKRKSWSTTGKPPNACAPVGDWQTWLRLFVCLWNQLLSSARKLLKTIGSFVGLLSVPASTSRFLLGELATSIKDVCQMMLGDPENPGNVWMTFIDLIVSTSTKRCR